MRNDILTRRTEVCVAAGKTNEKKREVEVVKHSAIKGGAGGAAPLLIIKFQSDKSADEGRVERDGERSESIVSAAPQGRRCWRRKTTRM